MRNDAVTDGAWVKVSLEGRSPNTDAIGALVVVEAGDKRWTQMVLSSNSFLSVNDRRLHFGVGSATTVAVTVRWPDGTSVRRDGLGVRELHVLREADGSP